MNHKDSGILILRFGLAFVLLWFGINQLISPSSWLSWLPPWTDSLFVSGKTLILLNGVIDTLLGVVFTLGLWIRFFGVIAFLHIFSLAVSIGWNDVGIRDVGLAIAALSLAFIGPGPWAIKK